jgi:hypothetical protein
MKDSSCPFCATSVRLGDEPEGRFLSSLFMTTWQRAEQIRSGQYKIKKKKTTMAAERASRNVRGNLGDYSSGTDGPYFHPSVQLQEEKAGSICKVIRVHTRAAGD